MNIHITLGGGILERSRRVRLLMKNSENGGDEEYFILFTATKCITASVFKFNNILEFIYDISNPKGLSTIGPKS